MAGAVSVRAQQSSPNQTASIAGRVVDGFTGQTLAGVNVVLSLPSRRGQAPVVAASATDGAGRFNYPDVPVGTYSVTASRQGYIGGGYAQWSAWMSASHLRLTLGEDRTNLVLRLWRSAAISGTVHRAGEPVVGARVTAMTARETGVGPRVHDRKSVSTDDRGQYRLGDLPAGTYAIAVQAGSSPTIYSPGVVNVAAAFLSSLGPGDEAPAVDVSVPTEGLVRLGGRVVGGIGPDRPRQVDLWTPTLSGGLPDVPVARAVMRGAGGFTFVPVPAGIYRITVADFPAPAPEAVSQAGATFSVRRLGQVLPAPTDSQTLWGSLDVDARTSRADLVVQVQPAARIRGQVRYDGDTAAHPVAGIASVPVLASPYDGRNIGRYAAARIEPDGSFTTVGLPPGRYALELPTFLALPEWRLDAISAAGRDVRDAGLELGATDVRDVVLTLSDKQTAVSGTVYDEAGHTVPFAFVYIFPVDARRWDEDGRMLNGVGGRPTGEDGSYQISDVPPGEYCLAVTLNPIEGPASRSFLTTLASGAVKIRVEPGASVVQPLTLKGSGRN